MLVEKTREYSQWIDSLKDTAARARHPCSHGTGKKLFTKVTIMAKAKGVKTKTIKYDVADHLRTPAEIAAYLDAWLTGAPDDAAGIARALGDIARAKGMTQVAKDAGLSREVCIAR